MDKQVCRLSLLAIAVHSQIAFAQSTPVAAGAVATEKIDAVIVTGTRTTGLKASDSPSPVQVLDVAALERTGQPDLIQALAQNLPSFTAQAFGGDTANLTLSAKLRGLSPNHTLVLINGKRRHTTANLAVLGGAYQGGAAADLSYIPVASIERIEVLQEGAAAQYGTDAIAGVVNIILKSNEEGGSVTVSGGKYFDGGGQTADISANIGLKPFEGAFINISAESKYHGRSDRGGIDPRVIDPGILAAQPSIRNFPEYPYVNHISGDAAYHLSILAMNAVVDLGGGTAAYSVFTYGEKRGQAYENYRLPSRLPEVYPNGFNPSEALKEIDYGLTLGIKGKAAGWNWDVSTVYGKADEKISTINSGNVSLFRDTGSTPKDFHAGDFIASQWTNNLDISREFDIGTKLPLSVAFGLEQRTDTYEIGAGDAASRYKEGSQSFPGFSLTDAGKHRRTNVAGYVDIAASPIENLKLNAAARFEHYSDFGNTSVGKLTARYDFTKEFALRGTISNGFRAPTLAEQFYSATNVSPFSAFVQLAPNSAGARLVGVDGLKAEKSQNFSLGIVLNPIPKMTLTLDAYQIKIKNRIVGSGAIFGSGGAVNSPAVVAAILANGNVLDNTVEQTGINIFSNAVDTKSTGAEFLLSYASNYGAYGRVDWSLAANYNKVQVTKINQAPAQLLPQSLLDVAAISTLETTSPKYRANLGALWQIGTWTINLREAIYGPSSEFGTPDGSVYFKTTVKRKFITDLEIAKQITKSITFAIGANNLFNQYPNQVSADLLAAQRANLDNASVTIYPSFSPIGINGGYYYAKASYSF
jgi:iron complex outermembrane recepter protein